jgi:putative membrane protein
MAPLMERRRSDMLHFLLRALFAAFGLAIASRIVPGVTYDAPLTLFLAALLLGVVNALLRPLLVILTLPVTVVTFGLFLLVINAGMILLVSKIIPGFHIAGFWPAVVAAVVTGVTSWAGYMLLGDLKRLNTRAG